MKSSQEIVNLFLSDVLDRKIASAWQIEELGILRTQKKRKKHGKGCTNHIKEKSHVQKISLHLRHRSQNEHASWCFPSMGVELSSDVFSTGRASPSPLTTVDQRGNHQYWPRPRISFQSQAVRGTSEVNDYVYV